MLIQSALCILAVLMLCGAAIGIYSEGKAKRAEDPTAYIYTREAAADAAAPGTVVLIIGLGFSITGWILGIHDENADKPVSADIAPADQMKQACNRDASEKTADRHEQVHAKAHDPQADRRGDDKLRKIRLAVLILAVICIIAGVANGNMKDILIKASNICTECIGLG